MKILIIHNQYQTPGGEDAVATSQYELLSQFDDIKVEQFFINSNIIKTFGIYNKIRLFVRDLLMLRTLKGLENKIDKFGPDIAHIHNIYPLINPAIYKLLHNRKVKIVQTLHNYRFLCPNGSFFRDNSICSECLEKRSFNSCVKYSCYKRSKLYSLLYAHMIRQGHQRGYFDYIDKFVALNAFMRDKMVAYGFDKEKFDIIPNGFDFDINTSSEHADYYLYIGRLSENKGITTLCEAFADIKDKLKIMGVGELEGYVKTMSDRCSNIEYIGFMSGEEKNQIIIKAKAIIVPSEWYENLPTVIIEAFSKGIPVIVSRLGGAQYMVDNGRTGFVFDAGSITGLREAVVKIHELKNNVMYEAVVDEYMNMYNTDKVIPKLLKLYYELLLTDKEYMDVD